MASRRVGTDSISRSHPGARCGSESSPRRGGVGRPRSALQPPSPCSEDAGRGRGSVERVGRLVCMARSCVGPRGAAEARDVPAKSFYPFRNKGSFCVLLGAQPSHAVGCGGSPPSRARSECLWGLRHPAQDTPSREEPGPGSAPGGNAGSGSPGPLAREKGRRAGPQGARS